MLFGHVDRASVRQFTVILVLKLQLHACSSPGPGVLRHVRSRRLAAGPMASEVGAGTASLPLRLLPLPVVGQCNAEGVVGIRLV